ncbi:methyltransferase [Saccharopolyspora taberi]|uniref:Methyltransferase n=1 Tax=Saccharopolyspora taberi TaxID=60895 RepID=A0ABN3V4P1_9PSEU
MTALPSPLPLMQLATGFWSFKTLAAAHELDVFGRLSGTNGVTVEEFATQWGLAQRPADALLTGLASLGLLDKKDGRYVNSELSETYLVPGSANDFSGLVTMFDRRLYAGWDELVRALKTNKPTTWDPDVDATLYDAADPAIMSLFWGAMHSMSRLTARSLGEAVDLSRFRSLLDIGGGSGAFDIELCKQYPSLRANVYDMKFVTEIAARNIEQEQLSDRIGVTGGDFFVDETYPAGSDLHLYSMIMHDWVPEKNKALLRKSFDALPSGGMVVICELVIDDDKTGPPAAALMSLNKLVETEGMNYTASEYFDWLGGIGFTGLEVVPFESPGANAAVLARKP